MPSMVRRSLTGRFGSIAWISRRTAPASSAGSPEDFTTRRLGVRLGKYRSMLGSESRPKFLTSPATPDDGRVTRIRPPRTGDELAANRVFPGPEAPHHGLKIG